MVKILINTIFMLLEYYITIVGMGNLKVKRLDLNAIEH